MNFPQEQVPWDRLVLYDKGVILKKALPNPLAVDFQKKVRTAFLVEMEPRQDKLLFPLSECLSLHLEISSKSDFMLPFAVKNVMDGLSNAVYFDDVQVTSLYAKKELGQDDVVRIHVLPDKHSSDLSKAILDLTVLVKPCDLILPNKLHYSQTLMTSPINSSAISSIMAEIQAQLPNGFGIINRPCRVWLEVFTDKMDADNDNLTLNYVIAMQGSVYSSIQDVHSFQVDLHRGTRDHCTVYVDE